MKFTPIKSVLIACASLTALTGAAHADSPPQSIVEFRAEALLSPEGRADIRDRIADAAQDVCRLNGRRDLDARAARQDCIDEVTLAAERRLERKTADVRRRHYVEAGGSARTAG